MSESRSGANFGSRPKAEAAKGRLQDLPAGISMCHTDLMNMKRREIWWERWQGGYKPIHWKAWVWLAGFGCALWGVMCAASWFMALLGRPDERIVHAACIVALVVWGSWFVERHTIPIRPNLTRFARDVWAHAIKKARRRP
jgi:hypothetical protein